MTLIIQVSASKEVVTHLNMHMLIYLHIFIYGFEKKKGTPAI